MIIQSLYTPTPDELYGPLFEAVQQSRVLGDTKTFVDSVPMMAPADIVTLYNEQKAKPDFDLSAFVHQHFTLPSQPASDYVSDRSISTAEHIERLWDHLTRPPDPDVEGSSRLALPYPYIVPGGRFREIFYWDSYFTMLGLQQSGRVSLIRSMVNNFAYLIDLYGFIPNGNRTYFLSRSQPPFFALMVQLLAEVDGRNILTKYLPQLEQEYEFWMSGHDQLSAENPVCRRVVQLPDGSVLNRHWDPKGTPRPEAYPKEVPAQQQAQELGMPTEVFYGHNRAACESGWDFSSRWFADGKSMTTIRAADLVPVDLNCLLYYLELTLATAFSQTSNPDKADQFEQAAEERKRLIQTVFWNTDTNFFADYEHATSQPTSSLTVAAVYPLFFRIATEEQANHVHQRLRHEFLQPGGLVTTLVNSGQQWDAPNGWAPLQWMAYRGLTNYGFTETAREVRSRWLALNDKVYKETGKMMEKYNVVDTTLLAGGGNYPNQDGFGWTNGVYLRLLSE
ncbi:alpha,alpha-trehalase TreF [Nibrella saemangeumensis]|uniref:Alpha,alpha-trehalase TreF n=1 Tax=Nibrella saemangeumensis TaxID=1084526 RepID=A0ABP8MRN8_9BACT